MFGPGGPYDGPLGGPGVFDLLLAGPLLPLIVLIVIAYLIFRIVRGGTTSPSSGPGGGAAAFVEAISVLAVGLLIALFVGFGLQAFYPAPASPEPPRELGSFGPEGTPPGMTKGGEPKGSPPPPEATQAEPAQPPEEAFDGPPGGGAGGPTPEMIEDRREFEQEIEAYQEEFSQYARVASLIMVVTAAILILAAALLPGLRGIPAIRDGVALGGILTLIYGLALALRAEGDVFRFLIVTIALITVLVAVYLRFRSTRREETQTG